MDDEIWLQRYEIRDMSYEIRVMSYDMREFTCKKNPLG